VHTQGIVERDIVVLNQNGVYALCASRAVKTIMSIDQDTAVELRTEEVCDAANGRSILAWLCLGASQGTSIKIRADGPHAREVVDAVSDLVNRGFDTGESCLPRSAA